jgi:hypothetical protein
MIYTHHPALHAAYPGTFAPCEVIVNGDLGGGNRPSIAQIDAQFADPGSKLNRKLDRARESRAAVEIDYEELPHRLEAVASYREPLMHLVRRVREKLPGQRIMVYGLPVRYDRDVYGLAKAEQGSRWWSDRAIEFVQGRAIRSAVAAQIGRSYGDTPRIGVADLADALSPVCYQGKPINPNRPDPFPASDVLPDLLDEAMKGGRAVVPMVWAYAQDYHGAVIYADPDEARNICGIIRDHGLRDVVLWMHDGGDIDLPHVRAVTDIYVEAFA